MATEISYWDAVTELAQKSVIRTGQNVAYWQTLYANMSPSEVAERLTATSSMKIASAADNGNILIYDITKPDSFDIPNPLNSNTGAAKVATMTPVVETTIDQTTNTVNFATKAKGAATMFVGSVIPALTAASIGMSLGKTIDSTLYNLNPDFWDSAGMASLNPDTWASITNGDTSLGSRLFNMIFGIDSTNGTVQPYVDETTYAYMAMWLNSMGAFNQNTYQLNQITDLNPFPDVNLIHPQYPLYFNKTQLGYIYTTISSSNKLLFGLYVPNVDTYMCSCVYYTDTGSRASEIIFAFSETPITSYSYINSFSPNHINEPQYVMQHLTNTININTNPSRFKTFTYNGKTVYAVQISNRYSDGHNYNSEFVGVPRNNSTSSFYDDQTSSAKMLNCSASLGWNMLYGDTTINTPIEGIGTQPGATLPNPSAWNDIPTTLQSLQQQYPSLWNDSVPITTLQPDGTTRTTNYVPVPMPKVDSLDDTKPVSSDQTQSTTTTTPASPDYIKDLLQKLLAPSDDNPTDTGTGDSPPVLPISGASSGLWAIYHPTQGQIDSFSSWLWSTNLVTQIQALMFSPIDAVISLHKIYCTPVDAGISDIQLGYLNSGISSNYVEQQYIYFSCGSVNVNETMGNVLDYSPNTSIHIYLPFIGIVPLDVDTIMRGTITVNYGVDILTGDCLATITVTRDGYNSVQYQHAGNCAVHYPLTSGNYMSMLMNTIGGAFSGASTGGIVGGLVKGGASLLSSKAQISRSGSMNGNAGAMGGKIPYLIIERPQSKIAIDYEHYQGNPTNEFVQISSLSGYVKASNVHVDGIHGTDNELRQIEQLLQEGILV